MSTLIKAVLTAAAIVAIALPLLFWANPAAPKIEAPDAVDQTWPNHPYAISPQHELLW